MGKLRSIAWSCLALCSTGYSQPSPLVVQTAKPVDFDARPTRYIGEKADEFIASVLSTLAMNSRKTDAFGFPQDPTVAAAKSQTNAPEKVEPIVPFGDVVRLIQISTVMAGEKRFLIGARSISQGDKFPVNYDGHAIWIEVIEVSARQVAFKNIQTGEIAAHILDSLPPGMSPGQNGTPAPGMTPAGQQAPLDLNTTQSSDGQSPR